MEIFYLKLLDDFGRRHADARKSLAAWKEMVESTIWKSRHDVLGYFPKAKMIKNNRARFEITHNSYRLIIAIDYEGKYVEIRFIGTHNEYDQIDPETI